MKKYLLAVMILACISCINQTINTESTYLDGHTYKEVWEASIKAVNDIDFTIDGMDIEAGFIGAESGPHIVFISLFATGVIPFAVLLTNSIVQDGHGSIPLLAESGKSFIVAKLVNVIIGLIVGYLFILL